MVEPFLPGFEESHARAHSNYWKVQVIVERLRNLGYDVDVTDWRSVHAPKAKHYDLVIGQARAFRASCKGCRSPAPRIFLGYGPHVQTAIERVNERVRLLQERTGIKIREEHPEWWDGAPWATDVFYVGNSFVRQSYAAATAAPLYELPNPITQGVEITWQRKHFHSARRHYLWLSAYGPVRRGLDVLLEVFRERNDCELWICGGLESSAANFFSQYRELLLELPNVHYLGWVDVGTPAFSEITQRCGFLLYPSASDGMPGSVVNSMAAGVIPIVTPSAGIDVLPWGFVLEELTKKNIGEVLDRTTKIESDDFLMRARGVCEHAQMRYSRRAFEEAFDNHLQRVLSRGDHCRR